MREGRHERKGHRDPMERREGRGRGHEVRKERSHSAQTFRRGRAIAFLEKLNVKRSTLVQQLDQPEYASIKQVISGELKATDAIIQEFIHTFELFEAVPGNDNKSEEDDTKHENQ
jgi:hypothetical protein